VTSEQPYETYPGVPARDLDEEDIAQLDAETLKKITSGDKPLYVEPKSPARASAKKTAKKRSSTKKQAPTSPPPAAEPESTPEAAADVAPAEGNDAP
jgi:hypothetical protein